MKVSLSTLTKKEYINTEGTLYLSLVLKTAPAFPTKFSTTPTTQSSLSSTADQHSPA